MSRQGPPQHRPSAGSILAALLACLLFIPINAAAAEQVGRVLVATGSVTAEQKDASTRALGRRDPIYAGDRIRTAARGRVQIRFEDGAMVDLDPSSTFEVEEYATEDEEGGGSAVMSFLKGAMRTITGAIGSSRGDEYRMNTTVATIGVRGTAYALEYCDAECAEDGGSEGLYGRVDEGEVEVDGPGGTGGFGEGQYFFVPDGGAPERIVAPPDGILDGEGGTGAGGDDDRIEDVSIRPLDTGDEDGIGLDGNDTDLLDPGFEGGDEAGLRPGEPGDVFFAGGFFGGEGGGVRGSAFILSPDEGDVRLESGAVVGAEFPNTGFVDASAASLTAGSTTLGSGANEFDIDWGWWQGPVNVAGGRDDDSGTFVYAYTNPLNITTTAELTARADIGGTNFYGPSVGGTLAGPGGFDSAGGSWFLSEIGVAVDFTNTAVVLNDFELTNSDTLDAFSMMSGNTTGSIDFANRLIEIPGLADSGGTREGDIWAKFAGSNAEGLLLRFDISGDNQITGVAILEPGS